MKKFVLAPAILLGLLSASPVLADTVGFDDVGIGVSYQTLESPYHGLTWTRWATIATDVYGTSGYQNGRVSPGNVGCGCAGDYSEAITYITSDSTFTFNSGYFTSAWNDGATFVVQGFLDGSLLHTLTTVLDTSGPVFLSFNWAGIDELQFSISGGTDNPDLPGGGNYFAADDLSFDAEAAVPEPASWAMMIGGLGLAGAAMRRRRSTALSFG